MSSHVPTRNVLTVMDEPEIEHSPNGEIRERGVMCQGGCGQETWNLSGYCWDCHPLRGLPQ